MRIRGAGEPGQEGVLLRHESVLCRQLPLPPEPSTLGPAVEVSLSASASPPPHTLGFHGYMGLGEAGGGSMPQPLVEHDVEGSERTPMIVELTKPALLTERALPDQSILGSLVAAQTVTLADLSASGVALFFVATLLQPLVFAHVNGFEVLGAELPLTVARSTPMRLLEHWAEMAFSLSAAACTFMIGRYGEAGPRLGVCLLPFVPPPADVVRSAAERRARLRQGATFLWCTLACMAGTPLADPIARALAGVGAFAGPITYTADAMHEGELLHPVFRVGASPVVSMMGMRPVTYDRLSVGYWLRQDAHYQQLLRRELELGAQAGESLLEGWAERIQPPPQELLDLAQVLLPDMLAADLLSLPYSPTYEPPKTTYLPRMPAQLPFVTPSCVRSAMELLTDWLSPEARISALLATAAYSASWSSLWWASWSIGLCARCRESTKGVASASLWSRIRCAWRK